MHINIDLNAAIAGLRQLLWEDANLRLLKSGYPSNHVPPTAQVISFTNSVVGLKVRIERHLNCGNPDCKHIAVIGSTTEVHYGSLRCNDCDKHCGWLSKAAYNMIIEVQKRFGRLTDPIVVRKGHA